MNKKCHPHYSLLIFIIDISDRDCVYMSAAFCDTKSIWFMGVILVHGLANCLITQYESLIIIITTVLH